MPGLLLAFNLWVFFFFFEVGTINLGFEKKEKSTDVLPLELITSNVKSCG